MVEQKVDELGHWRPIRRFTIVIEAMEVELAWIAPVRCQMCKRWAHLHAPMGAIASTRTPQPATNTAGRTPMRIAEINGVHSIHSSPYPIPNRFALSLFQMLAFPTREMVN